MISVITPAPDGSPGVYDLRWTQRVLAEEDLRRHLNGHRRVLVPPGTIVTPLADDVLRSKSVEIVREAEGQRDQGSQTWGVAQQFAHALVVSALRSLEREGLSLWPMPTGHDGTHDVWAAGLAFCVARGACAGGVVFSDDPALVCCVANKLPGLRAAAVATVRGAVRAVCSLAPNVVAVEMPGPTYFEVLQIVRTVCVPGRGCPPGVARTLLALEAGHADR